MENQNPQYSSITSTGSRGGYGIGSGVQKDWRDVTEVFREGAKELNVGQLVMARGFTLHDTMTAIEIMEPKMDTNMELPDSDKRLQTVDIEDKLIKGDFTAQELLLIMDEILVREMSWFHGHLLSQTIFTCHYFHKIRHTYHPILTPFCYAVLRCTRFIIELVRESNCFEEEDICLTTDGANLFDEERTDDIMAELESLEETLRLISMKKRGEELDQGMISMVQEALGALPKDTMDCVDALLSRIQLRKFHLLLLNELYTHLVTPNKIANLSTHVRTKLIAPLNALKPGVTGTWTAVVTDLYTLKGFDPWGNRDGLSDVVGGGGYGHGAHGPPRPFVLLAKDDALRNFWDFVDGVGGLIDGLEKVEKAFSWVEFWNFLRTFSEHTSPKPTIITRSLLKLFIFPHTLWMDYIGKHTCSPIHQPRSSSTRNLLCYSLPPPQPSMYSSLNSMPPGMGGRLNAPSRGFLNLPLIVSVQSSNGHVTTVKAFIESAIHAILPDFPFTEERIIQFVNSITTNSVDKITCQKILVAFDEFYLQLGKILLDFVGVGCMNQSRQRRVLWKLVNMLDKLQIVGEAVDKGFMGVCDIFPSRTGYCSTFAYYHKLWTMEYICLLGFDLELIAWEYEFGMMFWHWMDILRDNLEVIKKIEETLTVERVSKYVTKRKHELTKQSEYLNILFRQWCARYPRLTRKPVSFRIPNIDEEDHSSQSTLYEPSAHYLHRFQGFTKLSSPRFRIWEEFVDDVVRMVHGEGRDVDFGCELDTLKNECDSYFVRTLQNAVHVLSGSTM